MKRRFRMANEREAAFKAVIEFLETDLEKSLAIRGFSRGLLYYYVR